MNEFQMTTLWLAAFRYYCGRTSYAVSDFCDLLISMWPTLPERTQSLIRRDLEEVFVRDDEARSSGSEYKPLGHDCDRHAWERVRALWASIAEEAT